MAAEMNVVQYFALIVTLLPALMMVECRQIPADTPHDFPTNSTPCSIDVERVCSSFDESVNYSMQLDVNNFHDSGEIKVKVLKTICDLSVSESPWWYQLEVIKKLKTAGSGSGLNNPNTLDTLGAGGAESEERCNGEFRIQQKSHELKLCKQDSTVVFSSCSPAPLDLPKHFKWTAKSQYSERDSLCFRLTLQFAGKRVCGRKEVCVSVGDIPHSLPTSPSGTEADGYAYATVNEEIGDLEFTYMDTEIVYVDDEEILGETFEGDDLGVTVPAEKGCVVARAFFAENNLQWVPDCDCEGYYKSVQCLEQDGGMQCWCSTRSGSEIRNSRKTLNCMDSQSFDFRC